MIKAISRLIRLPNVAMVFLTMYLLRLTIVKPITELMDFNLQMPELSFLILVLSTVLITAAGNVINDYHDVHADRHNHPKKVVIDRSISRRQAIIMHFILNLIGISLGLFVSFYHRLYWLSPIFIIVPVVLWFYSTTFKHQVLTGNLLVSVLTGTVPLLVVLFEYPLLKRAYIESVQLFPDLLNPIIYWIGLFALFAFLTNLIREIVKDAEDVAGDKEVGSRTLAVVYGISASRVIALIITVLTLAGLSVVFVVFLNDWKSLLYFGIFLVIPLLILIIRLRKTDDSKGFHQLSMLAKIIMLAGLMYAPLAYLFMKLAIN